MAEVGITREDCGKRKCKDWLDFRMNCTNSDSPILMHGGVSARLHCSQGQYKRQFTLDGKTKTVDYCG